MLIKSWLPVFSGFYNNAWLEDDEYIISNLKEDGANEKELAEVFSSETYQKAYDNAKKELLPAMVAWVQSELQSHNLYIKIKFDGLHSPREYNFRNDSIDCTVNIKNKKQIEKFIDDNYEAWTKYLKDNFTSYDGFWSFHSNNPDSDEWIISSALKDTYKCGAILQFICNVLDITEFKMLEDLYEYNNIWVSLEDLREELKAKGFYDDMTEEEIEEEERKKFYDELEKYNLKLFK
jgi:hypothetical protein